MSTQKLIAGNWKMNGLAADLVVARELAEALAREPAAARVALCPPATLIAQMNWQLKDSAVEIGGQDCSPETSGAYTGDVSAAMLKDAGAGLVILGHSERRAGHGETDADVAAKVEAALPAGLEPIICVGETLAERQAGRAVEVVAGQVMASLPESLNGKAFAVIEGLLKSLDQKLPFDLRDIALIPLEHADANVVAPTLQKLMDARVTQRATLNQGQADALKVIIMTDQRSNALLPQRA